MTPDLERLNELYEKATPGEWSCHAPGCCGWIDYDDGVICDVKNNTDDLQDATGYAPTREQARANQEWIAAAHNAWPALYAQLRAAAPNRPIAQEAQQGPYHPSIAEQEVLRRALLASVKVIHPGVTTGEPPHAQAATAVSGDAAAHEQLATARKALEAILRTPAKPFPDPGSHSLEAWARAVHVAYCQMRFIAINALAAIDAERNRQ